MLLVVYLYCQSQPAEAWLILLIVGIGSALMGRLVLHVIKQADDHPYRSGRVKSWIKVKNPNAPAMLRIEEGTF